VSPAPAPAATRAAKPAPVRRTVVTTSSGS
jgi:hypothetical protein